MNRTLFRSAWALALTLFVSVVFLVWWIAGGFDLGRGPKSDTGYTLWSGWVAVLLYIVVIAYVGRKYIHRLRPAPPRERAETLGQRIEQAELALQEVGAQIRDGLLSHEEDVRARVREVLATHRARKLIHVEVKPGPADGPTWIIETRYPEPRRRVLIWLHAHLYLGLGAALLIGLHGGLVWSTPMGLLLNASSAVVTVTGLAGVWLWALGPTRLARAERGLSIEEAYSYRDHFRRKIEGLLMEPRKAPELEVDKKYEQAKAKWDELIKLIPLTRQIHSGRLAGSELRSTLSDLEAEDPKLASLQRDLVVLMFQHERVRSDYSRLAREKALMSAWRLVHVPVSIALVGLLLFHVLTVWWY